jgi:hypothetical protein
LFQCSAITLTAIATGASFVQAAAAFWAYLDQDDLKDYIVAYDSPAMRFDFYRNATPDFQFMFTISNSSDSRLLQIAGDFDRDGDDEFFRMEKTQSGGYITRMLLNVGGNLIPTSVTFPGVSKIGDVNGDGYPDIFCLGLDQPFFINNHFTEADFRNAVRSDWTLYDEPETFPRELSR